jgi:hypothetical protein
MYFANSHYLSGKTINLAKADSFDLPKSGIVDHLDVMVQAYMASGNSAAVKQHIHDHITGLEIIGNGKTPLWSLDGPECLALFAARHDIMVPSKIDNYGSTYNYERFPIFFGRKLFDGDYALDLSKWKQVQLKITNDGTTDNFQSTGHMVDVDIVTVEEKPSPPLNYLKAYEFRTKTPESDSTKDRFDLPELDRIALIMLIEERARTGGATSKFDCQSYQLVSHLRFGFRELKNLVLDEDIVRETYWNRLGLYKPIKTYGMSYLSAQDYYFDTFLSWPQSVVTQSISQSDAIAYPATLTHLRERLQKCRYIAAGAEFNWMAEGWGYLDSMILWDMLDKPESEWLVPSAANRKPVEIEYTSTKDDGKQNTVLVVPALN